MDQRFDSALLEKSFRAVGRSSRCCEVFRTIGTSLRSTCWVADHYDVLKSEIRLAPRRVSPETA